MNTQRITCKECNRPNVKVIDGRMVKHSRLSGKPCFVIKTESHQWCADDANGFTPFAER